VVAILGDGMGFTRQSQGKNVREDFGCGIAVALGAGDAKRKNAWRILVLEAQICQEQGMYIELAPDVVVILH